MIPQSPPESQRSREFSWNSIYVTPYKAMSTHRGRGHGQINGGGGDVPMAPVYAPPGTQRSAKRYCNALLAAALVAGTFWSLGSPAILAAFDGDWKLLAIARLAIGLGGVLPPASLFRSVRTYVRFALDFRVLLWTLLMPALWLTLRSDVLPPVSLRRHASPSTCDTVFVASVLVLLAVDAAAAAVPSAAGFPDGFRLEQQLFGEYQVATPPRLLKVLRRRMAFFHEAGALLLAPILALSTLIVAAECAAACHPYVPYLLPAALAACIAAFSLVAAAILTAAGYVKRSALPVGPLTSPLQAPMQLGSGTPEPRSYAAHGAGGGAAARAPVAPASAWAAAGLADGELDSRPAAPPINTADITFTPNVRRTLNLPPVPSSASEADLLDAVNASVAALAEARADEFAKHLRGRIYAMRPVLALRSHVRRCWRLRGLLSRACLLAIALVIEDAATTVALPLLCVVALRVPADPSALLWSAVCAAAAIASLRLGKLAVGACASRLMLFESSVQNRDSQRFLTSSPGPSPGPLLHGHGHHHRAAGGHPSGAAGMASNPCRPMADLHGGGAGMNGIVGGGGGGGGGGGMASMGSSPLRGGFDGGGVSHGSTVCGGGCMHTISLSGGGRTPSRSSRRSGAVSGAVTPSRVAGSPLGRTTSSPRTPPASGGLATVESVGDVAECAEPECAEPVEEGADGCMPLRLADCRVPLAASRNANEENWPQGNGHAIQAGGGGGRAADRSPTAPQPKPRRGLQPASPPPPPSSSRSRGLFNRYDDITAAPAAVSSVAPAAASAASHHTTAFVGATHGPRVGASAAALPEAGGLAASFFSSAVVGGWCSVLGASLAVLAAAAALPLTFEANAALPALVPAQPVILLCLGCFFLGGCLALGCGALHARLGFIADAVSSAKAGGAGGVLCGGGSSAHDNADGLVTPHPCGTMGGGGGGGGGGLGMTPGCDAALAPAPACGDGESGQASEWREVVESLRAIGAILAQPSLCVAIGMLPTRTALWAGAFAAGGAVLGAGTLALLAKLPARAGSRRSRWQRRLAQPSTIAAETPDTLLLSSPEEGYQTSTAGGHTGDGCSDRHLSSQHSGVASSAASALQERTEGSE